MTMETGMEAISKMDIGKAVELSMGDLGMPAVNMAELGKVEENVAELIEEIERAAVVDNLKLRIIPNKIIKLSCTIFSKLIYLNINEKRC